MASSLDNRPTHQHPEKFLDTFAGLLAGLAISWGLISSAYLIEGIRSRYEGMTSFTPFGLVFSLVLAPVWLAIHLLLRRYYRRTLGSLVCMAVPSITIVLVALFLIWELNRAWMVGPDY
jgi:hypothetical protein